MDLEKSKRKIDEFLNSEEGKKTMDEFFNKIKKGEEFHERWKQKTIEFLKTKSISELDNLYLAYVKHAEKRRNILYSQHIDGESDLNPLILDAIAELGTELPEEKFGMFTTCMYEWNGYIAEMYCGQGCFISISKKEDNG